MTISKLNPGDMLVDCFTPGWYTVDAVNLTRGFLAATYRASKNAAPVQAIVWETELRDMARISTRDLEAVI